MLGVKDVTSLVIFVPQVTPATAMIDKVREIVDESFDRISVEKLPHPSQN